MQPRYPVWMIEYIIGDRSHLPSWDYNQGIYFVTLVAKDRKNLFGEIVGDMDNLSKAGKIIRNEWLRLGKRFPYILTDQFVIMPNHVHGIIEFQRRGMAG